MINLDKEKQIDDIVAMLDSFMANNGGHMNITVDASGNVVTDGEEVEELSVKTMGCLDCAQGDMACKVPTLFDGIED